MSTAIASLFGKGINKHAGLTMKNHNPKYKIIFNREEMTGRILDIQNWETYGGPIQTLPLNPVHMSEFKESFSKRFFPIKRTSGDLIAAEDWDDDQYGVTHRVVPGRGSAMARAFMTQMEKDAADVLTTLGFSTASPVPGSPDGDSLFSTSHPVSLSQSGTTVSNRPSTDADLSHTAYYAAYANIVQQNEANNFNVIDSAPKQLIYNPKIREVAVQIAKGDWERAQANFNMNAGVLDNLQLVEWVHFRKTGATAAANAWNAWVILGDNHSLVFADRKGFTVKSDFDINVDAYVFVAQCRYDFGWSDWRSTYGSPGA